MNFFLIGLLLIVGTIFPELGYTQSGILKYDQEDESRKRLYEKSDLKSPTEKKNIEKYSKNTGLNLKVGGYYNSMFYITDAVVDNANSVQLSEDAEIHFQAEGSRYGFTFGAFIQLEGSTSKDQIDEHYVYVYGPFGKFILGAENSVADLAQVHAPIFLGWKTYSNNFDTWESVSNFITPRHKHLSGDANKISYFSPRVNGMQIGYSYTPDTDKKNGYGAGTSGGNFNTEISGKEVSSYSATYVSEVYKGMKLGASVTGEISEGYNSLEGEQQEIAFGLSLTTKKWEIGGNYFRQKNDLVGASKADIIHFGVAYNLTQNTKIGSVLHYQDIQPVDGTLKATNSDTYVFVVGGNTLLMPGVKVTYSIEYVSHTNNGLLDDTDSNNYNIESNNTIFAGVGLLLKF